MRRWHSEPERNLMLRRWREEIAKHESWADEGYSYCALAPVPPNADEDSCHCYKGMGFLRKKTPYGCSNPQCGVCKWEKYYGELRNRGVEVRAAIQFDLEAAA